jgi:putative protein-disulfide isomerase
MEIISGGMIRGNRIGPIGHLAPYISKAYKEVEQTTGVKFGEVFLEGILNEGSAIFNSEPPSIALSTYKHLKGADPFKFASDIQYSIYYSGRLPEDVTLYEELAVNHGISSELFRVTYSGGVKICENDFAQSLSFGVTGYPTLIYSVNGNHYWLSRGYVGIDELELRFEKLKSRFK